MDLLPFYFVVLNWEATVETHLQHINDGTLVEPQKEDPGPRWESWTKNVMFAGIPQQNML